MLTQNALMYPDDTALIELIPGQKLRREIIWKELDERANRIANALVDMAIAKSIRWNSICGTPKSCHFTRAPTGFSLWI